VETEYLPTTSYVILGLLTFREMSGYDLKQLINKSITHFYWSPAKSQIYGELRRLESHGLVTMREVPQTLRPDKRLYQITPEGTEAMLQWLQSSGVEADSYKSALLLKVFFGHMLSYDTNIGLLEERRKQVAQELMMCERRVQELQDKTRGPEVDEETFFPLLTLQRSIALCQADLGWLDGALGQLRQRQVHASTRRGRRKTSTNGTRSRARAV
jgi:PadR family transcriptional regulator, regulatory protein AphA